MPLDDGANGRGQGIDVQRTGDPEGANQVVSGRSRLQLIEKPKSILREGSWQPCCTHRCLCSLDEFFRYLRDGQISSADGMSMTGKRLGRFKSFAVQGLSSLPKESRFASGHHFRDARSSSKSDAPFGARHQTTGSEMSRVPWPYPGRTRRI